jgi:hypothetical protein
MWWDFGRQEYPFVKNRDLTYIVHANFIVLQTKICKHHNFIVLFHHDYNRRRGFSE